MKHNYDKMMELYYQGYTTKEISQELNIPKGTISSYLWSKGLGVNKEATSKSRINEHEDLIRFYIETKNKSAMEVSLILTEFSYSTIYDFCKRKDIYISVKRRSQTQQKYHTRKFFITEEELYELYHTQKMTLKAIGDRCDVTAVTVLNMMNRYNMERRTKGEAMKIAFEQNPERRVRMREVATERYLTGNLGNYKDTDIELMFKDWCSGHNVKYKHQFRIQGKGHPYDFIIHGQDLLVEVDGDYWHEKPEQQQKDVLQMQFAMDNGFRIVRFLRSEIYKTECKCFDTILEMIE